MPQAYNRYKNGTLPSLQLVEEIIINFNVNANWLLTGKGEMFLSDVQQDSSDAKADHQDSDDVNLRLIRDLTAENMELRRELANLREQVGRIAAKDNVQEKLEQELKPTPKNK